MLAAGLKPAAILVSVSLDSWYHVIMARYFTSDLHLGSTLINKYAHRPFKDASEALDYLTYNICKTCDCFDSLIHVGDFMLSGDDRHGSEEDHGLDMNVRDYLSDINPRVILLAGNHDDGHNCESDCKSMVLDLNQNYRNVYVNHFPSCHKDYRGPTGHGNKVQVNLCGHVHDKWLILFDSNKHVLNINVGVDVWGYKPVRDAEITYLLDYFRANLWTKIANDGSYWSNFSLTRDALEKFKIAHSAEIKAQREARKAEKHLKKGLTPEICQQRKEEALRKKGLLK